MRLLYFYLIIICLLLGSCKSKVDISMPVSKTGKVQVTNVKIVDHQIVISGLNLNSVTNFQIKDGAAVTETVIESKSNSQIIANTINNVTFVAGSIFDFVLSEANAASAFTVNFSLCDSLFNGRGFDCALTAHEGDVLTFNNTTHKWEPRSLNLSGLMYKGTWDANDAAGFPVGATGGDYYIVSVETSGPSTPHYNIGDWIVFNSTSAAFEHVRNSSSKQEGDYSLTQLADVDLTNPTPTNGMVLKYNSATSTWIPGVVTSGTNGTVTTVTVTPPLVVASPSTTPAISINQASTSNDGYLSSTDWNTFNNKQAALPTGGTTAQYLRGDKTLATLNTSVVPESGALYFTDARVRSTAITGFDNTLAGAIAGTDTIVQAFGKTQQQINAISGTGASYLIKNAPDTLSGSVSLTGTLDATTLGDIKVNGTPFGMTSAVNQSYVNNAVSGKLDKTAGGVVDGSVSFETDVKLKGSTSTNYVTLKANASTTTYNFVLPISGGTNGYVLSTDGVGNTSWIAMSGGGGAVSSVNTQTGAVVLTTDNISQGSTNLYYTNANALGTTLTAPTLTNSAIATSDTIQVAFGKLQAQLNNAYSKALTGLAAGSSTVIAATDTLLVALANLQAQITDQGSNKADKINGAQSITAATVTATTMNASQYCIGVNCIGAWPSASGDFKADGTVAMTGKFQAVQGAWNNPSISFASSNTTGLFDGGGYVGFSGNGSLLGSFSQNALTLNGSYSPYMRNFAGTTAATPGYSFSGSTTTGMFFLSPSGIGFSNAGVEGLRVTSSGVGIGVTSPAAKLDVAGEIKFGNTSSTCNAANEGQQRYNSSTKVMEFCNATAWTAFGSGGGGSGGLSGCPSGYTLIAASSTHGTNSFCINTTIKADATLPAQMSACMTDSAELCKNRQISAAMDALPAATLTEWTNVWTGDIVFGAVHNIVDVSSAAMMVYEAKSGWRQIGQKGPPTIYGNYTPNIPANSPFGGLCCKQ